MAERNHKTERSPSKESHTRKVLLELLNIRGSYVSLKFQSTDTISTIITRICNFLLVTRIYCSFTVKTENTLTANNESHVDIKKFICNVNLFCCYLLSATSSHVFVSLDSCSSWTLPSRSTNPYSLAWKKVSTLHNFLEQKMFRKI